jgi:hypothetical protein
MADVICNPNTRVVGQHRDEVRCPNAESGRKAGGQHPRRARAPLRRQRSMEKAYRAKAGNKTNDACDDDEAPVVLLREAGKNAEHIDPIMPSLKRQKISPNA